MVKIKRRTTAKKSPAKKPGKAVVTRSPAKDMPAYMEGHFGEGLERLGRGDFEVPRIQLLQAISPEVETFDAAEPGHFWHNMAEQDLGDELLIVPVFVDVRYILWRPRNEGGGILARADDGVHWSPPDAEYHVKLKSGKGVVWKTAKTVVESGLDAWGSSDPDDPGSQPAATLMYSIVCELPKLPELSPVVVTLQRSAIKVARKLLGKINLSRAPAYGMQFEMGSVTDQGAEGPYKNFRFTLAGFVGHGETKEVAKAQFQKYRETYKLFKETGFTIRDLESMQPAEGGTGKNADIPF